MIRKDPERWPDVVAQAQPFLDFFLDAVTAGIDPADAPAKAEAVKRAAPVLAQVGDRIVQSHHVARLAQRLQLDQRVIVAEVRRSHLRASPNPATAARAALNTVGRASHEDHLLALLLKHRTICQTVLPLVPEDDLMDIRNRELLRVLRDAQIPDLPPEQIIAGLDDAVADHAERLLATLDGTPAQFPGQIEREARQTLDLLGKERFLYLMRQLQAGIQSAQQDDDALALSDLRTQIAALSERHRHYYPPPSPYFHDMRSSLTPGR
ncbi:MAG: hypothetical protein H0W59_07680 [Chloroflexia bacterium]|nr:hypothetical protein [Chloroflexia bacterium]